MSEYLCSACRTPCKPQLHYVGVVADCDNGCIEAPLLVDNSEGDWQMMETAPKDGTEVWLLIRHRNYEHDPDDPRWELPAIGHWIDFNGGGWTWHGLMGKQVGWMPRYRPITEAEERDLADELAADEQAGWSAADRARWRADNQ